jgi:hypothetical protein
MQQEHGQSDLVPLTTGDIREREEDATQRDFAAVLSPDSKLVYDLRDGAGTSYGFYRVVSRFADALLERIEGRIGGLLDGYISYLRAFQPETARSRGEYALEFLTLGMAWRKYEAGARNTSERCVHVAQALLWLRRRSGSLKPLVDALRAAQAHYVLVPALERGGDLAGSSPARLERLIAWMRVNGELEQEALRLKNWHGFLTTLPADKAEYWIGVGAELFDEFEREAAEKLGRYTRGVKGFLAGEYADRGCREDTLFCRRVEGEYHLNMVAAELMNRGLRKGFDRMKRRVVLVPACMRGAKAARCRARVRGVDMICMACDPQCTVNRITRRIRRLGAKVYLVPHSTGFSKWLDRWQREGEVGVTAVACILNILPGGYEMRARGIPSQCVPLDYPGCKKHWDRVDIPTGVNEERLVQIALGKTKAGQ